MSRPIRWSILIAIPITLLLIFLISVPFRRWEFYIDRHSGRWSCTVTWCGVVKREHPIANMNWPDPGMSAMLTADTRVIHLGHAMQRYAWSSMSPIRPDLPDAWYAEAFNHLFGNLSVSKIFSSAERDALMRARIPLWNSPELDRDPRAVAENAQAENARITGVKQSNSFINP